MFQPENTGDTLYRESGKLRLVDGQAFDAERRYVFRPRSEGFAVFFDESPARLFHEVRLETGQGGTFRQKVRHICKQDTYSTEYVFTPDGRFSVRHTVRGPRKNYVSDTRYRREAL